MLYLHSIFFQLLIKIKNSKINCMNKEQELKTMIVLSLALLILFIIFKLKVFLLLVAIFLLLALIGGKPSYLISKYWINFAEFLGKVNSKVIIFITYYLFITPFAIIYRLFNKKQVCDFFDKKESSYFKDVNKKYEKKDLEQLW